MQMSQNLMCYAKETTFSILEFYII